LDVSGSSRFGFTSTNTHQFTGSVSVVGSVTAASFTGSLSGSITSALTASYLTPTNSYTITNLTASNISASGTSSFGYVGIGTSSPSTKLHVRLDNAGETTLALFENRLTDFASAAAGQIVVGARGYNHTVLRQNPDLGTTPSIGSSLDTVLANTCALGSGYGKLILATQSTASLIIDYSGNVGIGTASPTRKLDVNGDVNIGTNLVVVSGIYNANYYAGNSTATYFKNSVGTDTLTILQGGNVGIGTTSPADKLSVISGSVRIASSSLAGALYLGNDGSNIYLQRDNSYDLSLVQNGDSNSALYLASAGNVYVNIDSNNNDTDKAFIVQNNALKAGTELFRIQENGNVGVGTSSPTAKLHIYNGSSHFEATSNGNAAIVAGLYALQIAPLSNRDSTAGSYYGGIAFNHLLNHNGVSTYNGAPQAWIGTRLQDTAGSERDYLVFATKPGTGVSGTGNDIPIERMCIDRDGLVGIGITSPTVRLHVSGSTIITGSLNVSANITCLSLTETSTEAVKYNIIPLTSQLDNVLKLKPVSFNYKTNDKHSIGLIAEDVSKVYPEFTSDNNDSISYGKITSVLIQSIKELKTIIDNQQKQIENLIDKLK